MSTFPTNTTLAVFGVISATADGSPGDPTDVILTVVDPSGAQTAYSLSGGQVTRVAAGKYSCNLVPTLPGKWSYQWQGVGAVAVSMFKQKFVVE